MRRQLHKTGLVAPAGVAVQVDDLLVALEQLTRSSTLKPLAVVLVHFSEEIALLTELCSSNPDAITWTDDLLDTALFKGVSGEEVLESDEIHFAVKEVVLHVLHQELDMLVL